MSDINAEYAKKFAKQLGTTGDFVNYVARLESTDRLSQLANFKGTDGTWTGKRYLLVRKGGVIDFRHFFAAMMQRLEGTAGKSLGLGSTSEGGTLLLGVLNEVAQCVDEAAKRKLNSCFSREDLFSNRLGANFAEQIVIKRASANQQKTSFHLLNYLAGFQPLKPAEIAKLNMPGTGTVVLEALGAVLQSLGDALIPSAY